MSFSQSFDDLLQLSLDDLLKIKVSIASKHNESILLSSSSVTVFTRAEIKHLGISTFTELLTLVPGFFSMMDPVESNESFLVMRGHAQKYSNTILFLLDGQRMNEDYTGGFNYITRYFRMEHVERVEIIRGPGSSLYGSNAFTGIINIITKHTNKLSASIGEFSSKAVNISGNTQINNFKMSLCQTIKFYLFDAIK